MLSDESQGNEMRESRSDERENRSFTSSADEDVDKDEQMEEDFAKPRIRKDNKPR